MPMEFSSEGLTYGINYHAQPTGIFIVTYPKCVTTWTSIYCLVNT